MEGLYDPREEPISNASTKNNDASTSTDSALDCLPSAIEAEHTAHGPTSNTQLKRDPVKAVEVQDGSRQRIEGVTYNGIGANLIYNKEVPWTQEKEKILLGPYDYLFGSPGKDIRSQLVAAFNAWLKVPAKSLDIITRVVGMLHTASLL